MDALAAFLHWHCSADNVPRYDGVEQLAEALPGTPLASPRGEEPGGWVFDRHTPAANVQERLQAEIAQSSGVGSGWGWELVVKLPGVFQPRPPAPDPATFAAAHAELGQPSPFEKGTVYTSRRCGWFVEPSPDECATVADQTAARLRTRACRVHAAHVLAWWDVHLSRDDDGVGQPYALAAVYPVGEAVLPEAGLWGEVGPSFLAAPVPGATAAPAAERRVLHRVAAVYPENAVALHVGAALCEVAVWVDPGGQARDATASGCAPVFRGAAVAAARQWRWAPVAGEVDVRVNALVPFWMDDRVRDGQ